MRSFRLKSTVALAALTGLFAAGCGSSSNSSTTSAASTTSSGISAAVSAVNQLSQRPTQIPSTTPITKAIPKGKTIAWIQCGISDCTVLTPALKAAAQELGWTIKVIPAGLTPVTVKNAWDVAVREHPDAVFASGFPASIFSSELATLHSEHIPVVDYAVTDPPKNGIISVIQGPAFSKSIGKAMADWVLSKEGKKADTLFVTSSTFADLPYVTSGFNSEYSGFCSSCKVSTLNEPATSFGTSLPTTIVGYLRAHPSVNYLVLDEGSMAIGMPQALSSAGLTSTPVITQTPNPTTSQYLKQGAQLKMIVMPQMVDTMWQMVDTVARYWSGTPYESEVGSPLWLVTPSTVSQLTYPYNLVPNYQQKYKALWKKS